MKISIVAGARPNFMKIAPIIDAIKIKQNQGLDISFRLIHTGQHYDKNLSDTFFQELGIPLPNINLEVKSGSQAEQTAAIMIGFEKELFKFPADLVLVVGDVTSTMACSIVAKKEGVKVAHVEAGIRSGDMSMPEEINRIVTDSLTDFYFTTSTYANENLLKLGVEEGKIFFVGNVMIDTLLNNISKFNEPPIFNRLGLNSQKYIVLTLHRPSNVDEEKVFADLMQNISRIAKDFKIIFPVHPRTKKLLEGLNLNLPNVHYIEPLGYLQFNFLVKNSFLVMTDSGGITEETTVMGIPCLTLRNSTERPETCDFGTNMLIGSDVGLMEEAITKIVAGKWQKGSVPELWDGNAAIRIVDVLIKLYNIKP
ncbi:UDP-N-acetylglucosamine 2-epimerase (non-hydrolysing) [Maribacter sedimenticola]|uniref:UDP-N-acetylglucosamine 2-epimerase (Non-hydrolysing) n=1 Tax=Maribacter sedimenticola TaxID=228956 RepID=A0ABY1SJX0_9FLAO|nr:UDP-N-acetylglucosamine 2-epimerase (non-hydrolyzing) [Maribacter sedimenticola]SNR67023.1 UDP-N-acetylglucosamine 2-epimerase (non-hydrolysing) [Maribacter sedimenticola]